MRPLTPLAASFLEALRARDLDALTQCLHPRVQLRALHPGGAVVQMGAAAVAERFGAWLGGWDNVEFVRSEAWEAAGRLVMAYRVRLRDGHAVAEIEQHLHCDVVDRQLTAIDLLSTDTSAVGER